MCVCVCVALACCAEKTWSYNLYQALIVYRDKEITGQNGLHGQSAPVRVEEEFPIKQEHV